MFLPDKWKAKLEHKYRYISGVESGFYMHFSTTRRFELKHSVEAEETSCALPAEVVGPIVCLEFFGVREVSPEICAHVRASVCITRSSARHSS